MEKMLNQKKEEKIHEFINKFVNTNWLSFKSAEKDRKITKIKINKRGRNASSAKPKGLGTNEHISKIPKISF